MRYKSLETGEIVKIIKENDNFYTLSNTMTISKKLFGAKFSIINENVVTESKVVDAETFLNQPTTIQVNPPKTATQQYTVTNQAEEAIEAIDPSSFFSSSNINISGVDALKKIDTSKIVDVPPSQARIIKDVTNEQTPASTIISNNNSDLEAKKQEMQRLAEINQRKYQQIDENDESAINNIVANQAPSKPEVILNENGLTDGQEMFRKQQIELTGEDPYVDKIKKYKAQQGYNTPIQQPLNNPIPQQNINDTVSTHRPTIQSNVDPSNKIFSSFKRNYDIELNIPIKEKISKPEFIKIMADGIEGDIIQFYAEEILKTILSDIPTFQKKIYHQIYTIVYGDIKTAVETMDEKEQSDSDGTV